MMKIIFLITFVMITNAVEYEIEYAISSQYPTEWKKRGTMNCGEKRCTFENAKDLEFRAGKEDTYYLRIGDHFTSIPLSYLTTKMVDRIDLNMNGDEIVGIAYSVIKDSNKLTTYATRVHSHDFPKVKAETKEPPKEEKSWLRKNWYWVALGAVVLFLFMG